MHLKSGFGLEIRGLVQLTHATPFSTGQSGMQSLVSVVLDIKKS